MHLLKFDIVTLFPEMFKGPFAVSIIKRAIDAGLLSINLVNPRDYAVDKHRIVDDAPFGGGSGMVMKPEPIFLAVEALKDPSLKKRVLLLCPGGERLVQPKLMELAGYQQLILICGHYEGVDERIRLHLADESISIGDYVLTGGELAAMVLVDGVSRLVPGVLGAVNGAIDESFTDGLLEYPQYTRPRDFRGLPVPEILLSGDHARINAWRKEQSVLRTKTVRPDLFQAGLKGNK